MSEQKNNNRSNKTVMVDGQQIEMGVQKQTVRVNADGHGQVTSTELAEHENSTLLPPVQLTPGWEDAHEDSSLDSSKARTPPRDKWNMVYIIMMLNGIGVLMPWNMFINANEYFVDFKLNSTSGGAESTEYRKNFISYLGITAQIPNVFLNIVNMCAQCDMGNISRRIIISIMVMVLCFVITIVFAILDTSDWPFEFFIVTMATVVVINMATGVYQNSVFGLAAILPMKYTNAVVLGSNISGTLTAVISLITTASSPNPRTAAIYYFLSAILILLIDFDTYFVLPLLKFFRFYEKRSQENARAAVVDELDNVNCCPIKFLVGTVFVQCWPQFLCVWMTFFVTLCCFPGIQFNIPSVDGDFIISNKYFKGVLCFLFFNAFAVLGNFTTEFVKKPGPKWLIIPVTLRFLFIPFFALCNYNPASRTIPVYISNDYVYMVGSILHAYTHGYCSSLAMMYASKVAKPQYAGAAAMMAALFLVVGIFMGVNATLIVAALVEWGN